MRLILQNTQLWDKCLKTLEDEVDENDFHTWLRPIKAVEDEQFFRLHAPNQFVINWFNDNQLKGTIEHILGSDKPVLLELEKSQVVKGGGNGGAADSANNNNDDNDHSTLFGTNILNKSFTFDCHVEGKSNQIARAAAKQVSENPGQAYNPLFIYGGVGLGKTHLMHAAGNLIKQKNSTAKIAYVHSERFVSDMVKSLEQGNMPKFKQHYRSLDALLVDDIQFFASKTQTQEEFFHTFNTLLEMGRQIILTCDRFPKEINNLDERLVSRFSSGLSVRIDPPELETRVAILISKARKNNLELNDEVAFFIAKKVRSNVRDLEGALHRLQASSQFTQHEIDLGLAKDTLQDLTLFQERTISIENIQKTVADFFAVRVSDLKSKRRSRQIVRPRQMAMSLAKELTSLSLPDIGDAFGGRDHTTVIHACKKVDELVKTDSKFNDDYQSLLKILSV